MCSKRLSVITVCLNAERTLLRTLDSLASQSNVSIELIICDGGSVDNTKFVFEQWFKSIRVNGIYQSVFSNCIWIDQKSKGIYAGMNEALAFANSDFITFLNANDAYSHERVCDVAISALSSNPSIAAVFGNVEVLGGKWYNRRYIDASVWRPWMLKWGFMSPQPGNFVRSKALVKVGLFVETMQIGADFEWLYRFHFIHGFRSLWIQGIEVKMLAGGISMRGMASWSVIGKEMQQALRSNGYSISLIKLLFRLPFKSIGVLRAFWRQ